MFKCQKCGVKVSNIGMKLFITYKVLNVMCTDKKKHRDDWITDGVVTQQIRLCERCRKLNDLDLDLI